MKKALTIKNCLYGKILENHRFQKHCPIVCTLENIIFSIQGPNDHGQKSSCLLSVRSLANNLQILKLIIKFILLYLLQKNLRLWPLSVALKKPKG